MAKRRNQTPPIKPCVKTSADTRKCRQIHKTGPAPTLVELVERFESTATGHQRLTGWEPIPAPGIDLDSLEKRIIDRLICWPDGFLPAALAALGATHVYILRRPGSMTRYFAEGKSNG